MKQQRIFVADDAQDLLNDCALSGEPLIQSMSPETDAHEYALDEPLIRTIVGERRHLSAYEVRRVLLSSPVHERQSNGDANVCSCGNCTSRSAGSGSRTSSTLR